MKLWLAVAIVGLMLAVPAASATGWLQPRGDAAATGFQPEEGPQWPDVALDVQLDGDMRAEADTPPLILEDQVLFLARPYDDPDDDDYRVFSVDTRTGEVTTVAEGIERAAMLRMATDGQTLYVSSQGTVHAFPLEPEGSEWTWTGTGSLGDTGEEDWRVQYCRRMALGAGNVTVLCRAERVEDSTCNDQPISGCFAQTRTLVARLDAATGQPAWTPWGISPEPQFCDASGLEDCRNGARPLGLAVSDSRIVVLTTGGGFTGGGEVADPRYGGHTSDAWGIVTNTGELEWHRRLQSTNITSVRVADETVVDETESFQNVGNPAISDGATYIKAGKVHKLNLGTGETLWSEEIGEEDVDPNGGRSGAISLTQSYVFTTSAQTLYRMDQDVPEDGWGKSLDFGSDEGFDEQPIATPSAVYAVIRSPEDPETVIAFDTEDGEERWRHTGGEQQVFSFSVGQGLLAYTETQFHEDGADTSLVVLGRTEASPTVEVDPTTTYPEPGEQVEVNLSSSEAGVQGPVTRYKAIWGDGTTSGWQEDPVLRHSYNDPEEQTARFVVANDANQANSTTVTFHVGEEEPTEPNMVETAFKKDNQDMTFGVLGLAVALGGGAIGVARSKRKQSLLQQELEALEDGFEETREQASECEALLDNRKARARSLALDGKLEEQQVTIIEDRAEELRAELRVDALEDQFGFLPYSLVTKARQMVEDGTVTALERDAFLQAIEQDDVLTREQRSLVRERVEQWFARDAGGSRS